MELNELAAKETSALIERVERDIAELTGRLSAATAEREAAVERVTAEARISADALVLAEMAEHEAALDRVTAEARAAADALRAEMAERALDHKAASAALADARTQADGLRTALESVEALLATARTELIEARQLHQQEEAARQDAIATRDSETVARATAEAELQDLREVVGEHERARQEIEAKLEALAGREDFAASLLDGLVGAFATLATATTIPDVLTTLVEQLAAEFPRVALFRVRANRLEGQHQIGFDLTNDITKVVMPLSLDSLLTRAAASGHLESLSGDELADANPGPFGGTPSCAVALPLVVHGESLGIVYADDWGSERRETAGERAARIRLSEAMQQHAVAVLMRMTNELKTLAELRAYAVSLIAEIGQMYAADVGAEKTPAELRRRLQANIEYARSIFATRVTFECPDAAPLLEEEIAAVVERERGSPFVRDLEAVAAGRADDRMRA
jgi:hypothetical protein